MSSFTKTNKTTMMLPKTMLISQIKVSTKNKEMKMTLGESVKVNMERTKKFLFMSRNMKKRSISKSPLYLILSQDKAFMNIPKVLPNVSNHMRRKRQRNQRSNKMKLIRL